MNPLRQLAGQTAIYGLSSVIARILNFLLVPFYTRIFTDTAEYGIVNELYAYVAFFIVILTYGMETAYFRFASKNSDSKLIYSTAIMSLIFSSILFAVLILIFYPKLGKLLGYEEQKAFILLLGLVLSMDAITAIPFAKLRLSNQALKFAMIKLFNISINIGFNLFFLLLLPWLYGRGYVSSFTDLIYNPEFRVGYVFVANFLASFCTLLLFVKDFCKTDFRFSPEIFRSMLLYSFPLLISGLAGTVNEVIDRIMLRFRLPDYVNALEQIGIYGANVKIAVIMLLFIQMFRYASEPFFFSQEKNKASRELYATVLYYFTICGVFVFLFISLYIDIFIHIIGSDYHEGMNVVPVILLGNLMLGIYFNLSVWYKLREKTVFGAIFALIGALITLAINYYFIPHYGYMASAWGHLVAYSAMVTCSYLIGRRYYLVPYKVVAILIYLIGGIGMFFLSELVKSSDLYKRLIINSIIIIIFVVIVYIREKKIIAEIFFKKEV